MTAPRTLRPVTGLAPVHGVAQRPFGGMVGGLQARDASEGPQGGIRQRKHYCQIEIAAWVGRAG